MNKFYYGTDSLNWFEIMEKGRIDANTPVTPFKEVAQNFGSVILEIEADEFVRSEKYFKIPETSLSRVCLTDFEDS